MARAYLLCGAAVALLASSDAFTAPSTLPLRIGMHSRMAFSTNRHCPVVAAKSTLRRSVVLAMSTAEKQSPLEGGGERGLEEEERRITMWRQKFELDDSQVKALRVQFEESLAMSSGKLRTINKENMKKIIQKVSTQLDTADVGKEGRPVISEEELGNYVNALDDLWKETCSQDAIELANGECEMPLDTVDFDLSEVVAVFGMCVRDHCGIGGVCFWDSE